MSRDGSRYPDVQGGPDTTERRDRRRQTHFSVNPRGPAAGAVR